MLTLGASLAAGFLRSGFSPVIVVDTFSGDKLNGFLDAVRAELPKARVCVSTLHASDDVLRERVLNRDQDGFRDLTVSMRLNREAARNAGPFETLVDTSRLSPAEVAEAILCAVRTAPDASVYRSSSGEQAATSGPG